jgi:hypothetical protein
MPTAVCRCGNVLTLAGGDLGAVVRCPLCRTLLRVRATRGVAAEAPATPETRPDASEVPTRVASEPAESTPDPSPAIESPPPELAPRKPRATALRLGLAVSMIALVLGLSWIVANVPRSHLVSRRALRPPAAQAPTASEVSTPPAREPARVPAETPVTVVLDADHASAPAPSAARLAPPPRRDFDRPALAREVLPPRAGPPGVIAPEIEPLPERAAAARVGRGPVGRMFVGVAYREIRFIRDDPTPPRFGESAEGAYIRRGTRVQAQRIEVEPGRLKWLVRAERSDKAILVGDDFLASHVRLFR